MTAHTSDEKIAAVTKLSRWTDLSRAVFHEILSPDCEYINVPLPHLKRIGPDQAYEMLSTMAKDWEMTDLDVRNIICAGDVVLIERVERFRKLSDSTTFDLPSMGALEFRDGKIAAWRDYFDLNHVKPLLG